MSRAACAGGAAAFLLCALIYTGALAHETHEELPEPTPLLYEPPAPGSYELPTIDRVEEHVLLGEGGATVSLPGLQQGQVAIVSFVYRSCADAHGCPLALAVLRRLDRALAREPALAAQVRLLTVSFDPERDTPERMSELRRLMQPKSDWQFLTAPSEEAIWPVLRDYGQDALRLATADGKESPTLRHVLKVFLLDEDRAVRNVYSAGFLNERILLNDIQTVRAAR